MYGKPLGVVGGGVAGGGTLAYTGFYVGGAILAALALIVVGLLVVRVSYLERTARASASAARHDRTDHPEEGP